jgi:hypothetical protein
MCTAIGFILLQNVFDKKEPLSSAICLIALFMCLIQDIGIINLIHMLAVLIEGQEE